MPTGLFFLLLFLLLIFLLLNLSLSLLCIGTIAMQKQTTSLLADLVRLPSVNPMGRAVNAEICLEHRMTAYLEKFFKDLGVSYERQAMGPGRENIVAHYQTPRAARTVVFEAHQDTVPVENM